MSDLATRMVKHEETFECDECKVMCKNKAYFEEHIKKEHRKIKEIDAEAALKPEEILTKKEVNNTPRNQKY